MNISYDLSDLEINNLIQTYHDKISQRTLPYVKAQLILSDCTITIYTTNKVVFQGEGAAFYTHTLKPQFIAQAGSDEVGTGDVFGPVVVVACFVNLAHYEHLKEYPIQDSKKMTDALILDLGPLLMATLPHSLLILHNQKYNDIHQSDNMNAIKAKLHNQAYVHLDKKVLLSKVSTLNIIDQFTPKRSYFTYLEGQTKIFTALHFETKAESKYFAVACASIIARTVFLKELQAMGEHYKTIFPKGASHQVDVFAEDFLHQHGLTTLKKVAKLHFKNIQNLINREHD